MPIISDCIFIGMMEDKTVHPYPPENIVMKLNGKVVKMESDDESMFTTIWAYECPKYEQDVILENWEKLQTTIRLTRIGSTILKGPNDTLSGKVKRM